MYMIGHAVASYERLVAWDDDEKALEDAKSSRIFVISPLAMV